MPPHPSDIHRLFHDHAEFCRQCLMVQAESGLVVPMERGPAQLRLDQVIAKCQARNKPARIVVVKGRRVQVSLGTASHFFQDTAFYSGQHTAVIAQDMITVQNLFEHYKRFNDTYKPLAGLIELPKLVKDNDDSLEWENESWIKIRTARNLAFGRGFRFKRVHFSEFAFYERDARAIMLSVLSAVPKTPDTIVVVESTANGLGNEYYRLVQEALSGNSEWELMFFAWWEFPGNRMRLEMAPDAFQRSLSEEEREARQNYNLDLEQLNWRRYTIKVDCGGDPAKFRQEHPSNIQEAFVASGRPRFSLAHIERMPAQPDAITGGLEEDRYGVERRLRFLPREKGELSIYRKPVVGRSYVIGADAVEGSDANQGVGSADPDYFVAQVLDRDTGEQVAMVRARMEAAESGRYLCAAGAYYNWACIVPEANGPGLAMIDEMKRQQYPAGLIYHRHRTTDQDPLTRADFIGWKTTLVTRPQLISTLDRAIREMSVLIHDPVTLQEMRTFVIKPSGRAEHQQGCHDDTVFALALAIIGIEQMPRPKQTGPTHEIEVKKYGREDEQPGRGRIVRIR